MSSLLNIAAGSGSADFYGFELTNSLRFDDSESPYLEKTLGSGNTQTYSISVWFKRGDITSTQVIFHAFDGSSTYRGQLSIDSNQRLYFEVGGSQRYRLRPTRLFRDTSSWYNVVAVADLSNTTDADKLRIYVNGVRETVFTSSDLPTVENYTGGLLNSNLAHQISGLQDHSSEFDGYLAEFNFLDGVAVSDASSFGELKSGVWIPKDTSGLTFGNNGFRLEFKQTGDGSSTASASTIGADTSGQTNHFNDTNFDAHDVVPDSPTNSFSTLLARNLDDYTLSEGNLRATSAGAQLGFATSTHAVNHSFKKFYFEVRANSVGNGTGIGIVKSSVGGTRGYPLAQTGSIYYTAASGAIFSTITGATEVSAATYTDTDVIGIAVDGENNTVQFFKNGASQGTVTEASIGTESYLAYMLNASTSGSSAQHANFGQDSTFADLEDAATNADENGLGEFHHSVPSGFLALCTENFEEPSITPKNSESPEDYFGVSIWEGTGSSQGITDLDFSPDWVWLKERNSTSSYFVVDTVRTVGFFIQTNSTVANTVNTANLTSIDSNGFTVGTGATANESGKDYVAWSWLAGGAPTATNSESAGAAPTSGSVMINGSASTANLAGTNPAQKISANTEAGFSIVQYEGTGSNATIAHGLNSAPQMVIHKRIETDGTNWATFHHDIVNTKHINLNTTASQTTSTSMFNSTSPTSTVISVGTSSHTNSDNKDYIAYCFHGVEEYSKFGMYEGNASTNGTFVYTGFRPAFILIKRKAGTTDWFLFDDRRIGYNSENHRLRPNANNDTESAPGVFEILSNGFKLGFTSGNANASGAEYIYMAFAKQPFKYANARVGSENNPD